MFITLTTSSYVEQQVAVVDEVIDILKPKLKGLLVAGGAPRDWFFNKVATDIDIFIDPISVYSVAPILISSFGLEENALLIQTGENIPTHYTSNNISGVFTFDFKGFTFQVVIKNSIENPLLTFPCSLSLITYENFSINPTVEFIKSVKNSVLLFTRTNNSPRYERKIKMKFPNYSVEHTNEPLTVTSKFIKNI